MSGPALRNLAFVLVLASTVAAQRSEPAHRISRQFDAAPYEGVVIDVPVGAVRVEGGGVSEVRYEARIRCGRRDSSCRDRAERVELSVRERRGRLVLELDRLSLWRARHMDVEVDVVMPPGIPLELDLGVGEVELDGLENDVEIDVGVGEVTLTMSEDVVRTVSLDNGIGETRLRYREGKQDVAGILGGRDVYWNRGPGTHEVKVELNIGEILVRLR